MVQLTVNSNTSHQFHEYSIFNSIRMASHCCYYINICIKYYINNDQWECLSATQSWNDPPSLMKIDISNCKKLKSLLSLSNSCSTNIKNLQSFILGLKSLTAIYEEDVDLTVFATEGRVRMSFTGFSIEGRDENVFVKFHLKKFCIIECHKMEKTHFTLLKFKQSHLAEEIQHLDTMNFQGEVAKIQYLNFSYTIECLKLSTNTCVPSKHP